MKHFRASCIGDGGLRFLSALLFLSFSCASPGERATFELTITNVADGSHDFPVGFSPGWLRASSDPLFVDGEAASMELEEVAEEGDPIGFSLTEDGVPIPTEFGATYDRTGLPPGESWSVTIEAREGEALSYVSMFGASNDTFVGLMVDPFAREGDVTTAARFYDAGTEVNEPLGEGDHQPASGPGGDDEGGVVGPAGADLPSLADVLRIELTRI